MTATTALASRIDHVELSLVVGMAEASRDAGTADVQIWPVGGGAAVLCEPGSPFNKVCGVGFDGVVEAGPWDVLEREHAVRGARLQVEISTLADPTLTATLTGRGYRVVGFENVLALRLDQAALRAPATGDISVTVVEPSDVSGWIEAVTTGFLHPDAFDGPAPHETFDRAALERTYRVFGAVPGVSRMLAWRDGAIAGGASLYLRDGVALLCGAATLSACRRHGVQSALLQARLAHARAAGGELAVVTTQPGSKSQQNVQRLGFDLIYSRAILVREPPAGPH